MKPMILLAVLLASVSRLWGEAWETTYGELLQNYVTPQGVHYQRWHRHKTDRARLQGVVEAIGRHSLKGQSRKAKLAFFLNAYNAWILQKILESYPTRGPGGGGFLGRTKFFRSKSIQVAGIRTSFHRFENDLIRASFNEPRIHFALNCASASCPPLHPRAFTESTLDETLEQLTRDFINRNPLAIRYTQPNTIEISEIFKWYEDDFQHPRSILGYLNQYREEPIPHTTTIRYQSYQWNLNEAR